MSRVETPLSREPLELEPRAVSASAKEEENRSAQSCPAAERPATDDTAATGRSVVFIDSFVEGSYRVKSLSGKQVIIFEDSDQFGPSLVNMRTGDVRPLPDKSWFWKFYQPWRDAGRPTEGEPASTPCGPLLNARWVAA